jgi:hypothetical protein
MPMVPLNGALMLFSPARLELIDHCLVAPVLGGQAVVFAAGDGRVADQLAAAAEVDLGQVEVGLGGAEQGGFLVVVQLQQQLPGLDLLARLEVQRLDRAGHLQAQFHALVGLEAADRRQALLPLAQFGLGRGNADRRLGLAEHLHLLVDGEGLDAPRISTISKTTANMISMRRRSMVRFLDARLLWITRDHGRSCPRAMGEVLSVFRKRGVKCLYGLVAESRSHPDCASTCGIGFTVQQSFRPGAGGCPRTRTAGSSVARPARPCGSRSSGNAPARR